MNPSLGKKAIDKCCQKYLDEMKQCFELKTEHNHSIEVDMSFRFQKGYIVLSWNYTGEDVNETIEQTTIGFAQPGLSETDASSTLILRNEKNTDLIQHAVSLARDRIKGVQIRQIHSTSCEQYLESVTMASAAIEAEEIAKSLHTSQSDTYSAELLKLKHLQEDKDQDQLVENYIIQSTNIVNWEEEGQLVFMKDHIHEQMWMFHKHWCNHFENLLITMDVGDSQVDLQNSPWIFWDVQQIYFSSSYQELATDPDGAFASTLFPLAELQDRHLIHGCARDVYCALKHPDQFQVLLHFKQKDHVCEGYVLHRVSLDNQESAETQEKVFGRKQEELQNVYNEIAEELLLLRLKQHL